MKILHEDPPNFDPFFFDEYENKTQPMMDLSLFPPSVINVEINLANTKI